MFSLLLAALVCIALCIFVIPRHPQFGKLPEGERLRRIEQSPHCRNGLFCNQVPTPSFTGKGGSVAAMAKYFFAPKKRLKPAAPLPMLKIDLSKAVPERDALVWLGHSACLLQLDGQKILVDPLFGGHASPFFFSTRTFKGRYPFSAETMPCIDLLLLTHDHWDHLEYRTMLALKDKIRQTVCPLGLGAHLEFWGYDKEKLFEGDWAESLQGPNGLRVDFVPSRHFSGRTLKRDKCLWTGFVVESAQRKIYISGDGGYGRHFAEAGERFGGFDLAIMENGQYDANWKFMHMAPEESVQAVLDLKAKAVLPVHWGRVCISNHAWDDSIIRFCKASEGKRFRLLTPIIGQPVYLDDDKQSFSRWWEGRP